MESRSIKKLLGIGLPEFCCFAKCLFEKQYRCLGSGGLVVTTVLVGVCVLVDAKFGG